METVKAFESRNYPKQLRSSGLIAFADYGYTKPKRYWNLETRHPAYPELIELLRELGIETRVQTMPPGFRLGPQVPISSTRPLGDRSDTTFEILVAVATWPEPPTRRLLMQSTRTAAKQTAHAIDELLEQGVLKLDVASLIFAEDLPPAFPRLVRRISDIIGPRAQLLRPEATGERTATYAVAPDGAPRLFGADLHLRNLMALAYHGPLHYSDLARIVGASIVKEHDTYANAPFGRGGLVVSFDTPGGRAVALNATHPFAPELRTLLLRILELYPLPAGQGRWYSPPTPPPPSGLPWNGDKYALFGQAVQSNILFSIAELGWTFEAICVQVTKTHRETVKSALTSMEVNDGLLQSSRPPGPGFGARIVTIANRFGAKKELEALLARVKTEWPDVTTPAIKALENRGLKTLRYLQNRGYIEIPAGYDFPHSGPPLVVHRVPWTKRRGPEPKDEEMAVLPPRDVL